MRNKNIDAIKWVAIITMTIDHARYLNLAATEFNYICYSIGRIAYPLFLFLMAHYFYRTKEIRTFLNSDKRYITNLIIFSFISEYPFRLYFGGDTLNIFPTLLLAFVMLYGLVRKPKFQPLYFITPIIIAFLLEKTTTMHLQYGVLGIISLLFIYKGLVNYKWVFIAILSCLAMNIYYVLGLDTDLHTASESLKNPLFYVWSLPFISLISFTLIVVYKYSEYPNKLNIPSIGKFAYLFYPLHIFIYFFIQKIF